LSSDKAINFCQKGLFIGLAFLAGTFTSMAVFSGYTIMGQNHLAATVFGFTDIIHVSLGAIHWTLVLSLHRIGTKFNESSIFKLVSLSMRKFYIVIESFVEIEAN
jgi:hypothetical protein